jgi:hypothetical protein
MHVWVRYLPIYFMTIDFMTLNLLHVFLYIFGACLRALSSYRPIYIYLMTIFDACLCALSSHRPIVLYIFNDCIGCMFLRVFVPSSYIYFMSLYASSRVWVSSVLLCPASAAVPDACTEDARSLGAH